MSLFKSTKQNEECPQCHSPLIIKRGKQGLFLGCSNYPKCDYLKPLQQSTHVIKTLEETCPECHSLLQIKQGHFGIFIGCSNYPECAFTVSDEPQDETNITCPECRTHQLVERISRSGHHFYGCNGYPHCKFTVPTPPLEVECPQCQFPLATLKKVRNKTMYLCANKNCLHLFPTDSHHKMNNSFEQIVEKLKQNQVVAYPTEAVFGLGCNPNSEQAVRDLLSLKKRPEEKGLILVAHDKKYLAPYIDESKITEKEWRRFEADYNHAITWVFPAKDSVPSYLKGKFTTIAIRLCKVPAVEKLCEATGFALTSTSANLTTLPPCRTASEVKKQFGEDFPVLEEPTLGKQNPSEIRDIFTQHIFRQG